MSDDTFFTSSGNSPCVRASNFNHAAQSGGLTKISSLMDHPFIKRLPEAICLETLHLFQSVAADSEVTPVVILCAVSGVASTEAATESALDCVKQILHTRPKYIKMERLEFIARQTRALNTEGRG